MRTEASSATGGRRRALSCTHSRDVPLWFAGAMYNNSCLYRSATALQPPTIGAPTTFLAHCPSWVIETTDAVWSPGRSALEVNSSLQEFFYEGWESTSTYGRHTKGMPALKNLVWNTKRAFPDLRIHITDVTCVGNDIDGYKTIMPDVLVGTHMGRSELYGPPTYRRASWSGLAFCYVQRVNGKWQYIAEVHAASLVSPLHACLLQVPATFWNLELRCLCTQWVVHDELAAAQQLGVVGSLAMPDTTVEPHDCRANTPSWGWQPESASQMELVAARPRLAAVVEESSEDEDAIIEAPPPPPAVPTPMGKRVVMAMDDIISRHLHVFDWPAWKVAMEPFWTDAPVYDTSFGTSGVTIGLHDWFFGEVLCLRPSIAPVPRYRFQPTIARSRCALGPSSAWNLPQGMTTRPDLRAMLITHPLISNSDG